MEKLVLITALAVAAAGGIGLVELFIRSAVVAAGFLFAALVVDLVGLTLPFVTVGGFSVYPDDLLVAILLIAAIARLLRLRSYDAVQRLFVGAGLLGLYSLARGIALVGPDGALDEARPWLFFLGALIYFSTHQLSSQALDRIAKVWIVAGTVLAGVAVLRWGVLVVGAPVNLAVLRHPGEGDPISVLAARETLPVATAFFLLVPSFLPGGDRNLRRLVVGLLTVVVLMQHRTVWAAVVAGLLLLTYREPALGRRFIGLTALAAVAAVFFAAAGLGTDKEEFRAESLNPDTFTWRVGGWRALVVEDGPEGPGELLLGQPFGAGFTREVDGSVKESAPHSVVVEGLLRIGLVGLLLLVWAVGLVLLRLWRIPAARHARGLLHPTALPPLVTAVVVYGLAYHPEVPSAIAIGLAAAVSLPEAARHPGRAAGRRGRNPQVSQPSGGVVATAPPFSGWSATAAGRGAQNGSRTGVTLDEP